MSNKELSKDQQRSVAAWKACKKIANDTQDIASYTVAVKSTASLISNSGLMQTLAFINTKSEPQYKSLSASLNEWLGDYLGLEKRTYNDVMDCLVNQSSSQHMRATFEVTALLRWQRQFADSLKSGS